MSRVTPKEAKKIAQSYFNECLKRLQWQLDTVDIVSSKYSRLSREPRLEGLQSLDLTFDAKRIDFLIPDNFEYNNPLDPADITGMKLGYENYFNGDQEKIVTHLAAKNGLNLERGTLSYKALQQSVARAVQELLRIHEKEISFETDITVGDDWFRRDVSKEMPTAATNGSGQSEIISKVHIQYIQEAIHKGDNERSIRSKKKSLQLFIDVISDVEIDTVSKKEARRFKEALMKLPSNMAKRYPDYKVQDILKLAIPAEQKMKAKTVNGYLGSMQSFYKWSQDNGFSSMENNPFSDIGLKDKTKKKQKRNSFSQDQLRGLFTSPVYLGCKGTKQTERLQTGTIIIKDSLYWLPLIALYTGARMSEIALLHVTDIKQLEDIWYFDIHEDSEDKSVKTLSSIRKVPVHSKLIEFGLLPYVKSIEAKGGQRLFPDMPMSSDGTYSNTYSKKFSNLLKRLNLKTDKTSFHSFRHTIKDAFVSGTSVPEEIRRAILGHERGDVHADYGDAELPLKRLHQALELISYDVHTKK